MTEFLMFVCGFVCGCGVMLIHRAYKKPKGAQSASNQRDGGGGGGPKEPL